MNDTPGKKVRIFRFFLNLAPPQFVDITVPDEANMLIQMNIWRNQGFVMMPDMTLEWAYVIGVKDMGFIAAQEAQGSFQAEKAKLN